MDELNHAEVTEFLVDDRVFKNVRMHEVGVYLVPQDLLAADIRTSALDVVDIRISRRAGYAELRARSSILACEMLTNDTRLEVYPKFKFDNIAALLAWSTQAVKVLNDVAPVNVDEEGTIVDVFARNFLRHLPPVIAQGWIPTLEQVRTSSSDIRGRVDFNKTVEEIYSRGQLRFIQDVQQVHYQHPANRVVKSALTALAAMRDALAPSLSTQVSDILASTSRTDIFLSAGDALDVSNRILAELTLDVSRSYFYHAIETARPILLALGRSPQGIPSLLDAPFRVEMALTAESAIRNATSYFAGPSFVVRKEKAENLYATSTPYEFNPRLEPDIVVRPTEDLATTRAILDVKYKERPSPSDHYQLASYVGRHNATIGGFVTITDEAAVEGPVCTAVSVDGVTIYEYAIPAGNVKAGLLDYGQWIRSVVA